MAFDTVGTVIQLQKYKGLLVSGSNILMSAKFSSHSFSVKMEVLVGGFGSLLLTVVMAIAFICIAKCWIYRNRNSNQRGFKEIIFSHNVLPTTDLLSRNQQTAC